MPISPARARWWGASAVGIAAVLLLGDHLFATGGDPVVVHAAPTPHVVGGRCVTGVSTAVGNRRPHVSAEPTALDIEWVGGPTAPCRTTTTTYDAQTAGVLAAAVNAAPAFPSGTIDCPSGDGSQALLLFHHAGTTDLQLIVVAMTGCGQVTAPDRAIRETTTLTALPVDPLRAG